MQFRLQSRRRLLPKRSSARRTATCNVSCGTDACKGGIECHEEGKLCNITCGGDRSCAGQVTCAGHENCTVRCNGVESCDAGVGGGSGGIIQVECNDTHACDGPVSAAATDVRIFCNGQDSCGAASSATATAARSAATARTPAATSNQQRSKSRRLLTCLDAERRGAIRAKRPFLRSGRAAASALEEAAEQAARAGGALRFVFGRSFEFRSGGVTLGRSLGERRPPVWRISYRRISRCASTWRGSCSTIARKSRIARLSRPLRL